MEEFNTLEKVRALFEKAGVNADDNNYFIALKNLAKQSGMVKGMEYPYCGLIIHFTDDGLGAIMLNQPGVVLTNFKTEKMELIPDSYFFISNEQIKEIKIKKFAPLNSKIKSVVITLNDKKKHQLMVNVNERDLPYHNEAFARFMEKYSK